MAAEKVHTASRDAVQSALRSIGDRQAGFFTAYQASAVGVDRHRLQRLTAGGVLVRERAGIYRFAVYPESPDDQYWRALMLTARHQGVLSFETALSLFEVSTVNPAVIDVTVKRGARIRIPTTAAIQLHIATLDKKTDITAVRGLPATTLMRTLIDMIIANRGMQFVEEALESDAAASQLTSNERAALQALVKRPSVTRMLTRAAAASTLRT